MFPSIMCAWKVMCFFPQELTKRAENTKRLWLDRIFVIILSVSGGQLRRSVCRDLGTMIAIRFVPAQMARAKTHRDWFLELSHSCFYSCSYSTCRNWHISPHFIQVGNFTLQEFAQIFWFCILYCICVLLRLKERRKKLTFKIYKYLFLRSSTCFLGLQLL